MSENLKVNSKTSIMEFKRKHNKLVDGVPSLLEGEDVSVKTIAQTEPNWEIDIKSILDTNFFKDTSNLYAKFVLLGNELSLVISGKFIANADTNSYHPLITNQVINIPDSIAEKIYSKVCHRADTGKFIDIFMDVCP